MKRSSVDPSVIRIEGKWEPFRSTRFYTNLKEERVKMNISQERLGAEL